MRHKNFADAYRARAFSFTLLLLASTFVSSQVSGQSVAGEPGGSAAPPHVSQIPERLFRQFGGLVQLDVVVTDPAGRPVGGLKADDFSVLDNGQPKDILGFLGHGIASKADPPVELIVVLDLGNMQPIAGQHAKEEVIRYFQRNGGHLANPVSVFVINALGMIDSIGPSTDGNALAAEFAHPRAPSSSCRVSNRRAEGIPKDIATAGMAINPTLLSLICLGHIASTERQRSGRKLLVWVGPKLGISSGTEPLSFQDPQDAFKSVVWFSTLFREARITLFSTWVETAIDGSSGSGGHSEASSNRALANRATLTGLRAADIRPVRSVKEVSPIDLTRDVLAYGSGGGIPEPSLDLVKVIDSCSKWADTFYSISFDPSAATELDEYHDIKVQMKDARLIARTNPGYYDQPFYAAETNPGVRRVTLEEFEQLLSANLDMSDSGVARQIASFELTERLDGARLARLLASLRGKNARNALMALADLSCFLPLPSADILRDPPPLLAEQQRIISMAGQYLNSTITRFPDFIATRKANQYAEITKVNRESTKIEFEPMHLLDSTEAGVFYRQGQEVVDSNTKKRSQRTAQNLDLTTYGVFGPSLQIMRQVVADSSLLSWSHWEQDSNGRRAVFTYGVPTSRSLFQLKSCCVPDGDGKGEVEVFPGHHGEITIDPATGAVLRFSVLADIKGFLPVLKSDLMIDYGPVNVGGTIYICPIKSVAVLTGRSRWERAEWGWGFLTYGPPATQLNDFEFDNYHIFRSSSRVLTGDASAPQ